MSELFPHTDELASAMWIDGCEIVAFDLDGERYCPQCARDIDGIDCERFHRDPYSVPYGGSVERRHMAEVDHEYHCGNMKCGRRIQTPSDV